MAMDRCAVAIYPLLGNYNPWFTSDLLNALYVADLHDMIRARNIQSYLDKRYIQSGKTKLNIFSDPQSGWYVACGKF